MSAGSAPTLPNFAHANSVAATASASGDVCGPGLVLEQSPTARSIKAGGGPGRPPSDPPSEFSSWHDDASSSLATFCAGDRTITVNTQRIRMGEHLKGKLQGMIRQKFDNYLHIIQTLQNETGKLAALTCELRVPVHCEGVDPPSRTSISCNEDGTFLVYLLPDATDVPSETHGARSGGSEGKHRSESFSLDAADGILEASTVDPTSFEVDQREVIRHWVAQVCEFGMSGQCHSLTSLFHFGHTAWRGRWPNSGSLPSVGVLLAPQAMRPAATIGETPCDSALTAGGRSIITEEEASVGDGSATVFDVDNSADPAVRVGDYEVNDRTGNSRTEPAINSTLSPHHNEPPSLERTLHEARIAAENDQPHQAVDLCMEGIALARCSLAHSHSGASSSAAAVAPIRRFDPSSRGDGVDLNPEVAIWELLLLRATVQAQLCRYNLALTDAEELIVMLPTGAEGYYWQSVALHGLGRSQEALEALMSALEFEPQNPVFTNFFTSLFEEISTAPDGRRSPYGCSSRRTSTTVIAAPVATSPGEGGASSADVPRRPRGGWPRGGRDALSTTTQATHLSSRSTTPTEVSERLSPRSSSNDSLSATGAVFEDGA